VSRDLRAQINVKHDHILTEREMPMAHINKRMHKQTVHAFRPEKSCCKPEVLRKAFMVHKFPVSECLALFNQQTAVINIYK
jgi:hypothetical protein